MPKLWPNWDFDSTLIEKTAVLQVALMHAGKLFDETLKIQRACFKKLCKNSMQPRKFC